MKCFIWNYVQECSDRWHSEGGIVVFAENEKRARELANTREGCNIREEEKPDEIREVIGGEEKAFWFPDAGCC